MGRADDAWRERRSPHLNPGLRRPAGPASFSTRFAAALAAVFALLLAAAPASAAVLVSNIDESKPGTWQLSSHVPAHGFTTGANSAGYTLDSVEVHFVSTPSGVTVKLMTGVSTSNAGTAFATLTNPATLTTGNLTFTAPANTTLSANTTYFVVVEGSGGGPSSTPSDAQTGAAGWSIDDDTHWRTTGGTSWSTTTSALPIRVNGSAVVSTTPTASSLVSNTGQSNDITKATSFQRDRSQPFTTGANTAGYRLTGVRLNLRYTGSQAIPTHTVNIFAVDSNNQPTGSSLGTLTNPASLADGNNEYTASGSGISLSASTTYAVVFGGSSSNPTNGNRFFQATSSDNEDSGAAAGWTIGDGSHNRASGTTAWTASTGSGKIAILGRTNTAPTVANAIPDQGVKPGSALSYAFPANTFADADGDTLTYTATKSDGTALPSWLTFTASTRTFSGTRPAANTDTVSVKVTASDGTESVSDTFDIGTNNAPTVANPIPDRSEVAAKAFSYQFAANTFNDADGDTLTYSATLADGSALPAWLSFAASTRTFSGTTPNVTNTVSVKVTASDGTASVSDTFDVTLTNNDPVVANPIPDQFATVGVPFVYPVPSNTFSDPDGHRLSLHRVVQADGTLPFWLFDTVLHTVAGTPGPGDVGTVELVARASDPVIGSTDAEATFTITVSTMPAISSVAIVSKPRIDAGNDGTKETYGAGQKIFVDVTWNTPVAWDVSASGAGMRVQLGVGANTRAAELETGGATSGTATTLRFSYTVVAADTDSDGITVNANASGNVVRLRNGATLKRATNRSVDASLAHAGLGAQAGHLVAGGTAAPTNAAPTFGGTSSITIAASPLHLVSIDTNRSDFTDADGDPLTFSLSADRDDTSLPGYPEWSHTSLGGFLFFRHRTSCALASLSPALTSPHTTTVTVTATDPDGASVSVTRGYRTAFTCPTFSSALVSGTTLTVTLSADAHGTSPGADEFTVKVGGTAVALADTDPVAVSESTVTLTLAAAPAAGQAVTVSYAPDEDAMNAVSRAGGPMATAFADQTVSVNRAPTVANEIPDKTLQIGAAFSYQVAANAFNDADGDTLTYTATKGDGGDLDSWMTFTAATRTFSGTLPGSAPPGDRIAIKVTASDGRGGSVSDTFDFVANSAPTVANAIPDQTAVKDAAFSFQFAANAFADGDPGAALTYSATQGDGTALPSWLTFTANTRTFSGTPTATGTTAVKVTADDGLGGTVSDTFDIEVVTDPHAGALVKNTGQAADAGLLTFATARAQPFTTGSNVSGYTLTRVTFPLSSVSAIPSGAQMRIERSGSNGRPGGSLGTLTLSRSGAVATGTTTGIDLTANTTYFAVMSAVSGSTDAYRRTSSDDEDSGAAAGWSIGNTMRWGGAPWGNTQDPVWMLAVHATVKTANAAPTLANAIPDQTATTGTAFSYAFPANTFADTDIGTTLSYTATKGDGTALPSWLSFTASTRTFSGTPTAAGTLSVTVTASDGTASVSGTFDIVVAQAPGPTVSAVAISSTPSLDTDNNGTPETYGAGGTIRVRVTFSEAVTVTGTPRITIRMDPNYGEFQADYESGSGSANLVFAYTVGGTNILTRGIAVVANSLTLNGGTIKAVATGAANAVLAHTALAHDATHQVDYQRTDTSTDPDPGPATPAAPGTNTPSAPPAKPAKAVGLRVVEAGPESIRLSWKLTDGGRADYQGYNVYRCTVAADAETPCDPYDGWWVGAPSDTNTWTDTDVTEGETYRYTVSAAPYGRDEQSLAVTVTAESPAGPPPSAPTGLAVTEAGDTHVRLRWQAPVEDGSGPVKTIDIYRCNLDNDPDCDDFLLLASRSGAAQARYRDNDGVEPGTTYRYAVGANRGADVPAPWSEPVTVTTAPKGAPPVGVSPARVMEAPGATLDFRVSIGKAAGGPVTVDYATADGTAAAGADYVAASGTLTFMPGERIKRVKVAVLDDAHDEGEETLTLTLSNPSGAYLSARAATATGTIENADPLPKAWLARFGRTGAVHIVDILDARFDAAAPTGDRLVLGGRAVDASLFPRRRESSEIESRPAGDTVSHWMPEQVRHDEEGAESRGQSKIERNVADGDNGGDFTLTPSIPPNPAGHAPPPDAGANATALERALWQALTNPGALDVDKRFLSQSSFHLSLTDLNIRGQSNMTPDPAGSPDNEHVTLTPSIETARAAPEHAGHWSLWGRGAMTRFQGMDDGVNLDGEVLTGLLGLDYAKDRWLAGVALAYHDGDGGYRAGNGIAGDLDSSLITVNPYLRYALTPRLSVWGTAGYGTGTLQLRPGHETRGQSKIERNVAGGNNGDDFTLTPSIPDRADSPDNEQVTLTPSIDGQAREAQPIETGLSLSMGALGVKGIVLATATTELAIKSDALWVRTASETTDGLQGAAADASRIRVLLSGRHQQLLPNDALLSPTFELGIRYDDGDAETGFGMELGGGLQYMDPVLGLTAETRARVLIAHEDGGYEEWGIGGSLSLDPGRLGRGLALRLDSGWGIAQSNAEALWQRQSTAGMAPQHNPATQARFNAELGYGLDVPWTYAILTPYGGMEWAGPSRALRLGWRFDLGQRLNLSFEGERMESGYGRAEHSLMLRTTLPW